MNKDSDVVADSEHDIRLQKAFLNYLKRHSDEFNNHVGFGPLTHDYRPDTLDRFTYVDQRDTMKIGGDTVTQQHDEPTPMVVLKANEAVTHSEKPTPSVDAKPKNTHRDRTTIHKLIVTSACDQTASHFGKEVSSSDGCSLLQSNQPGSVDYIVPPDDPNDNEALKVEETKAPTLIKVEEPEEEKKGQD